MRESLYAVVMAGAAVPGFGQPVGPDAEAVLAPHRQTNAVRGYTGEAVSVCAASGSCQDSCR